MIHQSIANILYLTILYYDQQMYNYFTNYHTPKFFETIASFSRSS